VIVFDEVIDNMLLMWYL